MAFATFFPVSTTVVRFPPKSKTANPNFPEIGGLFQPQRCRDLFHPRQDHDRDNARCSLLILGEARQRGHHLVIQACPFWLRGNCCPHLKLLGAYFHRDQRIGNEVVVPVGVGWGAAFGGNDHEPIAIRDVSDWINPGLSTFCANGMQQEQCPARKRAANLAGVGPKLLDDRHVPFIYVAHSQLLIDLFWLPVSAGKSITGKRRALRKPIKNSVNSVSQRFLGQTIRSQFYHLR
jgi:hypothetical protein